MSSDIKQALRHSGQLALAGLLIGLLIFLSLVAVSPSLHSWLHPDANDEHHQCAVTAFQKQHLLTVDFIPTVVACEAGQIRPIVFPNPPVFSSMDCRLSPSRAPPVSPSSQG